MAIQAQCFPKDFQAICRDVVPINVEMDAIIDIHNAEMRKGLCEMQKRHCREFMQMIEIRAAEQIAQKDSEIDRLQRERAELEARLSHVAAEGQIWFNVARNSEGLVTGLRATLDQLLRREADVAGDAESCCDRGGGGGGPRKGLCRVCGERGVSVVVVPCRHLCMCADCDRRSDTCPVCGGPKNVGFRVLMD